MKSPVFEVHIEGMRQGMHSIMIPKHIAEPFLNTKDKRVRVEASFKDKTINIHSALLKDKEGNYRITFGKTNQKALGIYPTDYFNLQLFENKSKYGVNVPEEMEAVLLSDYEGHEVFESLAPGRQRGLIYTISRYKNSQTKIDKSLTLMENLKRGIKDHRDMLKKL